MYKKICCSMITLSMILYTVRVASAKHSHWCSPNSRPSGKCGIHLDELLESICGEGNFYSPDFLLWSTQDNTIQDKRIRLRDVLLGKRDANIYLKKRRNYYYQGIVCECCINQCTTTELRTYCNLPVWNDTIY